jgi:hypothetical protein
MPETRGIGHLFDILKQPLFAGTTIHVKGRDKVKPEKHVEVFDLTGTLKVKNGSLIDTSIFEIDGVEFCVTPDTWIVGLPHSGSQANAKGTYEAGRRMATCLSIR